MRPRTDSHELEEAMLFGVEPAYDPHTGAHLAAGEVATRSHGARAGLEPPRFCQLCGRRMQVQVAPMGWDAYCSRHGAVSSTVFER